MTKTPALRTRKDRRAAKAPHPAIAAVAFTPTPAAVDAPVEAGAELFRPTRHDAIRPDPSNPRKIFDDDGLAELAASIVRDRLLEPIVIRALEGEPGQFMLIAGERRWRAIGQAIAAGDWPADRPIPAMLRDVSEADARRLALVENLQRRDLNAVEEARALAALAELTGASAAQIGRDLGFTERWAQQRLSLLKLPEPVQAQVEVGKIKVEEARELVALLPKLPAAQRVGIERGQISVAGAKAWLAEQPTPLGDAAVLAMLELLEKAEAQPYKPNDYSTQAGVEIVAATTRVDNGPNGVRIKVKVADPAFDELVKRDLLELPREQTIDGVEVGRHYVQRRFYSDGPLKVAIPEALNAKARLRLIAELRVKLHGLQRDFELGQSGEYATAWLNTPPAGELPAPVQAAITARREAREQQSAEYTRQEEARIAERKAADQAHATALAAIGQALEAALQVDDPAQRAQAIAAAAAQLGHPLPWFAEDQTSMIVDAAGVAFTARPYNPQPDEIRGLRLVVGLANAAAGLKTPQQRPGRKDPDAPPRGTFVFQVAAALQERLDEELGDWPTYCRRAEAGLEAFLRGEAIDYGDAAYEWGPDGVEALAHGIEVDGLGQQVDLEEAIEAAAEPTAPAEFSPSLLALAGVPAQAAE